MHSVILSLLGEGWGCIFEGELIKIVSLAFLKEGTDLSIYGIKFRQFLFFCYK